jgi:CMP-N-acetylneuraminic acid synthetase
MKTEITAIIVARNGSVRIKSKSMLKLDNETLISRKIKQLQAAKNIDRIVFGSDSDEMLKHAKSYGVEIFKRPDFYCDETKASANDMIENMMSFIKTDIVVWTHCTNPLLSTETYDRAISVFLNNQTQYDSLLSVKEFKEHLWDDNKKPLNYNPYQARHTPARELPSYYMQDGGIFIQPYIQMFSNRYFFGKKPYLFVIPDEEFLDINDERDYLLAKAILENKND